MKILMISNLYPSKTVPSSGVFVKNFCNNLDKISIDYKKVVLNVRKNKFLKVLDYFIYFSKVIFSGLFNKYNILYIHYISHNAIPTLLIKKFRKDIKIYINVHGSDILPQTKTQEKMQRYVRKAMNIADKIITPSEYYKQIVMNDFNIEKNKINVYPSGGINNNIFNKREISEEEYRRYGLNNKYSYIGYVSRIAKGKGWDYFLKAINILINNGDFENKKAIIIGSGEEVLNFKRMIKELNLEKYIVYIDFVKQEDLAIIYNIIDVFIFPTVRKSESLGLVGVEAMACKTPVIASDMAAPGYIVKSGINGFKFKPGNYKDLAAKIKNYYQLDNNDILLLQDNAYTTAEKYFSENCINNLKKMIG